MGFSHLRIGQKSPHLFRRAQGSACSNGGLTNPTFGQSVDSLKPLNISWDTTCLPNVQSIDIVLSSPGSAQPLLQGWESLTFATGYRVVQLLPRKWNDSASQQLQLSLYQSGTPSFMSPLPAGPVFTATYSAPSGSVPAAADMSLENGSSSTTKKSSSHGKTAAGILIPLLLIIAGIITYVRIKRRTGKEKRKRWSEMVDKRMSTISTDWKSMSTAGAQAAIRHSMAVNARDSSFSFGSIRPPSTAAIEPTSPDMAQIRRPGTGLRNPPLTNAFDSAERVSRVSFADTVRVSRVSFAADPRPSIDSRRTIGSSRASRAFHSAYTPPVPSLPQVYSPKEKVKDNDEVDVNMSPRQAAGPITLSPEDIRARIQSVKVEESDDDIFPALAMMRTGTRASANNPFSDKSSPTAMVEEGDGDDYLLPPSVSRRLPDSAHPANNELSTTLPSFPMPTFPPASSAGTGASAEAPLNPIKPLPLTSPTPVASPTTPPNTPPTLPPPSSFIPPDAMTRAHPGRQASLMSRSITNSTFRASLNRHNSVGTTTTGGGGGSPDEMLRAYAIRRTTPPFGAMPTTAAGIETEGGTPDDMLRAYAERRAAQAAASTGGTHPTSTAGGRLEKRPSFSFGGSPGGGSRLEKRPSFSFGLVGKKGKKKDRDSSTSRSSSTRQSLASPTVTASKTMPVMSINYTVTTETETETEGETCAPSTVGEVGKRVSGGAVYD
ncbi:hypothetical protein APHAL10511_005821 [Amanita phalloides]|nr:hypothetical protein APHAL10511_005821 [Amanita phalloides]